MSSDTKAPAEQQHKSTNPLKKLFHKKEKQPSEQDLEADAPPAYKKKESISTSGPYILVKDEETGKEVLKKNPHWPNEESWKEEERTKGSWAMGSEMGLGGGKGAGGDFGGTVG